MVYGETAEYKANMKVFEDYQLRVQVEDGKVTSAKLYRMNPVSGLPERDPIKPSQKDLDRVKAGLDANPPKNGAKQKLSPENTDAALKLLETQIPKKTTDPSLVKHYFLLIFIFLLFI